MPRSPWNAGRNAMKASPSSKGAEEPPFRSPRQCMAPAPIIPRRLCVVMGPFMGWKSSSEPPWTDTAGIGLSSTAPPGSPRSHARLSKSPKMWQLAQAESPWPDRRAS